MAVRENPIPIRPLYCTCRGASPGRCRLPGPRHGLSDRHHHGQQFDCRMGLIAAGIARQCKWRPQGQCLITCLGLAVCNLDGLTFVDAQGRTVPRNPESETRF